MHISTNHELKEQLTSGVHAIAQTYIILESMEDIPGARAATISANNPQGVPSYILG